MLAEGFTHPEYQNGQTDSLHVIMMSNGIV